MRTFLALILILHVLVEGMAGLTMVFQPRLLVPDLDLMSLPYMVSLGGAAISMALVAVWFWPRRREAGVVSVALGVMATYHTAQSLGGALVIAQGGGMQGLVLHLPLAICFWLLWAQRRSLAAG